MTLELDDPRRIHVLNAGGAGMGAIARILATMGHVVSGYDPLETSFLGPLRALGVELVVGPERPELDPGVDLVVRSTATPVDDSDVVEAEANGVPVVHRSEVLSGLSILRRTLAVAGTHGKTSTSAMLASALHAAGLDPSFLVGAEVASLGANAGWTDGPWFVVEADESDGSFLHLHTAGVIVTNVEPDHLEHWGGFEQLVAAFGEFLAAVDGPAIVCADDPVAAELGRRGGAVSYGTAEGADHIICDIDAAPLGIQFTVRSPDGATRPVSLRVPGVHNARNATAALALALEVGLDGDAVAAGLGAYTGVARRFEVRGEVGGVTFVDSYDHLPTEIRSALGAAAAGGWERIVCVFQPHRYSRTEALWQEFGDAFTGADVLCLTDIYPAGEPPRPGVTGQLIADAVRSAAPDLELVWLPTLDDVVADLSDRLRPGDLCLTLGAGDLTTVPDRIMERRRDRG